MFDYFIKRFDLFVLMLFVNTSFAGNNIEETGEVVQVLEPLAGFAIAVAKKDTEGVKQISKTVAMNYVATKVLKRTLNNVRINGKRIGEGPQNLTYNFPSGHTSTAFAGTWCLHKRYGYSVLPLLGAAFVGYSTVHSNFHDWEDVVGGAITGIASASLFTRKMNDDKTSIASNYNGHRGASLTLNMQL